MGCTTERFGPEEEFLKPKMLVTGFEKHSAEKVLTTVLRYSRVSETLSESQFAAIHRALGLEDRKAGPQIRELYDIHFIGQSVYILLITSTLLSSSSPRDKSSALFDVYDTACDGSLPEKAVEALLGVMFSVATAVLRPMFAEIGRKELKYFEETERNIAKGVQAVKAEVLAGSVSISRADFISKLSSFNGGLLLVHPGLRKYLKDQTPPPAAVPTSQTPS